MYTLCKMPPSFRVQRSPRRCQGFASMHYPNTPISYCRNVHAQDPKSQCAQTEAESNCYHCECEMQLVADHFEKEKSHFRLESLWTRYRNHARGSALHHTSSIIHVSLMTLSSSGIRHSPSPKSYALAALFCKRAASSSTGLRLRKAGPLS